MQPPVPCCCFHYTAVIVRPILYEVLPVSLTDTMPGAEQDPNAEPLHWLEIARLKATVYAQPFTLPPGVVAARCLVNFVVRNTQV